MPGKLADPRFRKERARKAGAASQTLDARIDSIVRRAPELTEAQKDRLRALLGARES